jgi:outer membrane murein-binding lipoprotein Lpp
MSTLEMEQLQNEKTRLEEESRNLDEELKQLESRSKILGEKIAIQELKNENAAKRQTINQLASKISTLETRLEQLATGNTQNQAATETNFPETGRDEETIRVMALDNQEEIIETAQAENKESQGTSTNPAF